MGQDEQAEIGRLRVRWALDQKRAMRRLGIIWFVLRWLDPLYVRLKSDEKHFGQKVSVLAIHLSEGLDTLQGCGCAQCRVRRDTRRRRAVEALQAPHDKAES